MKTLKAALTIAVLAMVPFTASAQDHAGHGDGAGHGGGQGGGQGHGGNMEQMQHMHEHMGEMGGMNGMGGMGNGSDQGSKSSTVFATIQDVVRQLQTDPETDWSQVNIDALHQHLVDMEMLSLFAKASAQDIDGGAEYVVTGEGRTLEAIQRMLPAHASQIESELGWQVSSELIANGARVRVVSTQGNNAAMIRALGFMGFMVLGDHHEPHHMAMAGASGAAADAGNQGGQAMDHGTHSGNGHQGH